MVKAMKATTTTRRLLRRRHSRLFEGSAIIQDRAPTSPWWGGRSAKRSGWGAATRKRLKTGTIERARQLRDQAPDQERRLWFQLRELKPLGYHFRRQVPIRGYFLDFAEHRARPAIEIDGSQHGADEHQARDAIRDLALAREGYRVVRFWTGDVREDIGRVVETVLRELECRYSPTRPASRKATPVVGTLALPTPTRGR